MIKIKVDNDNKDPFGAKLVVNGVVVQDIYSYSKVGEGNASRTGWNISISREEIIKQVAAHRFSDLPEELISINFSRHPYFSQNAEIRHNLRLERDASGQIIFSIVCNFIGRAWKHLWSIQEYINEFKFVVGKENNRLKAIWDEKRRPAISPSFSVLFPVKDVESTIEAETLNYWPIMRELHELTEASLMSKLSSESVVMQFDFPEEVRVPCEQYLLYFVQFLKDLGVEATADLQHEAGQVLFAVTPADKNEALDTIHAALKTYLQLASSPITGSPNPEDEIAIQRLLANVDHLKSQLRLSYMMVRTQEATIQAQQNTITSQQRVLSGEVLLDSLKNVTPQPKNEDKEDVIDGVLALKKYDYKGVEVNLAELYRRFKQLFKKDE